MGYCEPRARVLMGVMDMMDMIVEIVHENLDINET